MSGVGKKKKKIVIISEKQNAEEQKEHKEEQMRTEIFCLLMFSFVLLCELWFRTENNSGFYTSFSLMPYSNQSLTQFLFVYILIHGVPVSSFKKLACISVVYKCLLRLQWNPLTSCTPFMGILLKKREMKLSGSMVSKANTRK
ncbi:hypothetical protein BDC45DRAFT_529818 [Circinella umbellata]|nr:hypothetical protein BDC45DRAFT_529818 [Circinella umbellata]